VLEEVAEALLQLEAWESMRGDLATICENAEGLARRTLERNGIDPDQRCSNEH